MSGGAKRTRCAVVAITGRPNVGKSTLVNAIVGSKVAIATDRPQTTRRALRGVVTGDDWQLVLVDLPGVQRPMDVLTQRMKATVTRGVADADSALFVVDAEAGMGPGDRHIAHFLAAAQRKRPQDVLIAVNKVDRLSRSRTVAALDRAAALEGEVGLKIGDIFPVSARRGTGVRPLVARLAELAPGGPFLFSSEDRSDLSEELEVAELVREQVIRRVWQELPHAVEVSVIEMERRAEMVVVQAEIWVDTESQRAIVLGRGGSTIKQIGVAARKEIERRLGSKVYLDLRVTDRKGWRKNAGLLDRVGIVG